MVRRAKPIRQQVSCSMTSHGRESHQGHPMKSADKVNDWNRSDYCNQYTNSNKHAEYKKFAEVLSIQYIHISPTMSLVDQDMQVSYLLGLRILVYLHFIIKISKLLKYYIIITRRKDSDEYINLQLKYIDRFQIIYGRKISLI